MGFTDFASNVVKKYRQTFIPQAIELAESVNTTKTRFVWTTGSWLVYDYLVNAGNEDKRRFSDAIEKGYIAWHALPFTMHSELLDAHSFADGIGIAKKLDGIYGVKTIAAKATDVPGHTIAIVPLLAKAGVKLLHIGVNGASAMPDTPKTFLWRYGDSEIVVIYEGSYGGAHQCEYVEEILYFHHTNDNKGPGSQQEIIELYQRLHEIYPGYEIIGSRLDEYASVIWSQRDKLPVIECEIGDTWIHGVASDPFKTALLRELQFAKSEWIEQGVRSLDQISFDALTEKILIAAEHTWGLDVKRHLGDFDNYLRSDFLTAMDRNSVTLDGARKNRVNATTKRYRESGEYQVGSYQRMEESWREQRQFLIDAIKYLPTELRENIKCEKLLAQHGFSKEHMSGTDTRSFWFGKINIEFDQCGLKSLKFANSQVIKNAHNMCNIEYKSYSSRDYGIWRKNYMRDYIHNSEWSEPDFLRPGLNRFSGKYPTGYFGYTLQDVFIGDNKILTVLKLPDEILDELGCPPVIEVQYTLFNDYIDVELLWTKKPLSRLPEAIFFNIPTIIASSKIEYVKMGKSIDPFNIVSYGNRNISCTECVNIIAEEYNLKVQSFHAPLTTMGKGKIVEFKNAHPGSKSTGITYILYNNVWGTNFPLWYADSAYFKFRLTVSLSTST
jgi:hypothetical protein